MTCCDATNGFLARKCKMSESRGRGIPHNGSYWSIGGSTGRGHFFSFLSKVVYERVRSCTSGQDFPYKNFWQICKFNISCPSDKKLYTNGVKIGSLPLVANPRGVWSLLLYIRLGYKPGSCMLQTYNIHYDVSMKARPKGHRISHKLQKK